MALNAKQTTKNTRWRQSLYHALNGVKTVVLEERNARFELIIFLMGVLAGWWLKLDLARWCAFITISFLVLASEAVNTAIESVANLASNGKYNAVAGRAKDCAAATVLLTSIASVIVGLWVFGPGLLEHLL